MVSTVAERLNRRCSFHYNSNDSLGDRHVYGYESAKLFLQAFFKDNKIVMRQLFIGAAFGIVAGVVVGIFARLGRCSCCRCL